MTALPPPLRVFAHSSSIVNDREIPILCYVTDRRSLSVPAAAKNAMSAASFASTKDLTLESSRLVEKIVAIAAAGVDWVQIREKDLAARPLAALTREAVTRTRGLGSDRAARVIVNDRLDVAITEAAGGVHLGEVGLPVGEVARWLKRAAPEAEATDRSASASQIPASTSGDFLIGASCHSLEGASAAARDGADYIFFGPVFATPSKTKFGEPQGVTKLAEICRAVSVPVIAIGGITLENAGECISVGAAGIAAIRLFQDADDPAQIISTLKKLRR
jgi:thiamine-phosphate pyrophosphorylase